MPPRPSTLHRSSVVIVIINIIIIVVASVKKKGRGQFLKAHNNITNRDETKDIAQHTQTHIEKTCASASKQQQHQQQQQQRIDRERRERDIRSENISSSKSKKNI